MNILTGCLAATEGDVRIDGLDIFEDAREAKKRIGYLPEQPPLYPDMTDEDVTTVVDALAGVIERRTRSGAAARSAGGGVA